MKGDTLLYLILTNKEGLVRDKKAEVSLGCNDHEMELRIPRDGHKTNSRITTWDFRREDYNLFRDLLVKKFMGYGPGKKRGPGQLVDFKDHLLQAQE